LDTRLETVDAADKWKRSVAGRRAISASRQAIGSQHHHNRHIRQQQQQQPSSSAMRRN